MSQQELKHTYLNVRLNHSLKKVLKMDYNVLKDFKFEGNVSEQTINKYEKKVPSEIINLWKAYGYGTFLNGYLKVVNLDEYIQTLQETSSRYTDAVVLFTTSMGDLIIWSNNYVRLVNYRRGIIKTILSKFTFFFQNLESQKYKDEYLDWNPYLDAVKKYGEPGFDECFGYVPILGLGGSEKVENLKKVKLNEHIYIITDFMGPVE